MAIKSSMGTSDHPECKQGEVFLTNEYPEGVHCWQSYNSLRVGKVAYTTTNKPIEGMYPLFVSKEEYDSRIVG